MYTFAANDVLDTGVGIDENAVYLLARHVEETSETWRMLRIDTQDGSETVLWQTRAKSDTSYYFSGCLDNQLVLKEIRPGDGVFDDPLEQLRHQVHTLYLLSPAGGDLQPLYSWQQDTGLELPARDELFYVSDGQLSQLTGSGGLTRLRKARCWGSSIPSSFMPRTMRCGCQPPMWVRRRQARWRSAASPLPLVRWKPYR